MKKVFNIAMITLCFMAAGPTAVRAASVTVTPTTTYQTMDGFGAFGAMNVWWSNGPFWNDNFLNLVFDTLGLTLLRTELYPQPDQTEMWTKQIPYLKAVNGYVTKNQIPFRFFASIWTPPASMKTNNHTSGGKLEPSQTTAYGTYVVDYCKRFKTDVGADLYAVSAQNEPALSTGYNSAAYMPNELTPILIGVADAFVAAGISTILHWPDNIWWGGIWEDFNGATQSANLVKVGNILSWHYGDVDEVKERAQLARLQAEATGGTKKFRMWNTEFGGYYDDWNGNRDDENGNATGDAWLMAKTMHMNMQYGFNAIVWWQLSEHLQTKPIDQHYGLLYEAKMGIRGAVMRNFARFIRPGAVRVGCASTDAGVWSVAFKHDVNKTMTVLLINNGTTATTATLGGAGLPATMDAYQTSPTQNCVKIGSFAPGATINLPVKSITTISNELVNNPTTSIFGAAGQRKTGIILDKTGAVTVYGIDGRKLGSANNAAVQSGAAHMGVSIKSTGNKSTIVTGKSGR